ncbi:hypothetical protein AAOE16_15350 [Ekhidna sp. MALMAid0563]|uniref:hypothetical protein n=1 Tax=Ekhidna sp. MALMAid0563 TaxID=3143937 RepID=UPI0032DF886D
MRWVWVFSVFLGISFHATAQVKFDAKPTGKHARAIDQAKSTKETAKSRREQVRILREQSKARALYKQKYDSIKSNRLNNISNDSLGADSLSVSLFLQRDSIAIAKLILEDSNFPPEYRDLIINPIEIEEALSKEEADSIALAKATAVLGAEASKFLPDELEKPEDPLSQFKDPLDDKNPESFLSPPNPNLVKPEAARELFKKVDLKQFKEAQTDIQKLKKKYNQLPDTRYPEEGTKRNSLEDIPFKQRIYFGGNISLQSTDPLILSTNLQLGYWINKQWLGGVGITLREQFTAEDSTALTTGDGHGYSFFTRYNLPKDFFAWVESEWQIDKSLFGGEQRISKGWQKAYLIGIGREFKIGFVQMMSMIMYDLNYQNNDLNVHPWVFRLGVRFTKEPW